MKTIRFLNKDLTVAPLQSGELQAFFRQAPSPKEDPTKGKWMPFDGIALSKHTPVPAIAECRKYWTDEEPGYGNAQLKSVAKKLDTLNLPPPAEITTSVIHANQFLGTETALTLNDHIEDLETHLAKTNQTSLHKKVENGSLTEEKPNSLLKTLVDLTLQIGRERGNGNHRPLVSPKIVIAILVLTPILHIGNLTAAETMRPDAKTKVEQAYTRLQKMDGAQIKALLQSIPTEDRIDLVKYLPDKIIPFFIPKELATKNVDIVPDKELQKGFAKISLPEFQQSAKQIKASTQDQLFKLLIESSKPKNREKTAELEPA